MFVPFQQLPYRTVTRRASATRNLFGIGQLIVVILVVGCGGWLLFQNTVHRQLRDRVQAKISDQLRETGLLAKLGQARFHEGQGIQLNNLQIELANATSSGPCSRIEIYEVFIHAPATMTQLASSELKIRSIELRRAKLTVVRNADGQWDFKDVIASLAALKCDSPIPISMTDCEVRIVDQSTSPSVPITLTNVNLEAQPIVHDGRELLQITGGFQSSVISQIEFTTFLDNQTQTWQTQVGATNASLSGDLIALLPPAVRAELKELQSVSGKIDIDATATGKLSLDEMPSILIKGKVKQLTIDDTRLPFPIRNVSANFEVNNHEFSISNASGKLGLGDFSVNYWQRGFIEREQWHCDGILTQFNFDNSPRLSKWLPAYCKKFCYEYSPAGTSNIEFDLTDNGHELKRRIIGDLTNMSFSFIGLPYKVENTVGRVTWIGDLCNFDVRSFSGREAIDFKGHAKGLGKEPTYEINISVPGELPIDQKMHDAISVKPKFAQVLRAFRPTGRLGGIGKIEKRLPNGVINKTFDIRLKHCSIRHDNFDYPIHNIVGLVHTENDDYTFSEISGSNSSGNVTCNGNWNPINGLNVRFLCESVPLDDQLRFALKPELREIWNGFRPRGTMDFMRIDMRLPYGDSEVDLNVEARMEKTKDEAAANYVSIHPVWFPYEINHLVGTVNIGDGKITLKDCEGTHQRTTLFCQGDGRYSDEAWSIKLRNLLVTSLKVDEDLLVAVPRELAPPIRQLNYQGLLDVSGEVTIAGTSGTKSNRQSATQFAMHETSDRAGGDFETGAQSPIPNYLPPSSSLAWDVRFDMTQANMLVGVPVKNVFGSVQLVGVYDGKNAECRGELNIDSLTIYNAQITNIKGPIWLDNSRVSAGKFSGGIDESSVSNISPISNPIGIPDSVTGRLHKGIVKLDARMDTGGHNQYYLQATLADGCLSTACREFGAESDKIDGRSFAAVRLAGNCTGIHSQRGEGTIQLRDANIYELPVFLRLLKILNIGQLNRTAFDSSNIDFTVQGENIDFNRMEFLGDAISLIGNGRMNLDREIDLNFYSIVGRNRFNIPVLSDLYHASSQKILCINVDGTLENPQTHRHVLPQLNDSIRQLFQPREYSGLENQFDRPSHHNSSFFNQQAIRPSFSNTIQR